MNSTTTKRFRSAFAALPPHVQSQARKAYRLFRRDLRHPSLQFKKVHTTQPIFSARVSLGYRALAVQQDDTLVWFWIGSHADYDRILSGL